MDNSKLTSYMIVLGICLLGVFGYVATYNMLSLNNSSNSFFSKVSDNVDGKIDNIKFVNNELVINTVGEVSSVCVKSTKSRPGIDSICWKNVKDNKVVTSIYEYKSYYIWIKDANNNISDYYVYKLKK